MTRKNFIPLFLVMLFTAGFISCPVEIFNQSENSAEYTVKYYFEKTDGSGYEQDSKYPDIKLSGTIGEKTEASAKTVKGFTADTISQKEIQADGSTVVEIKYKRNQYTLTFSDVYNLAANIPSSVKYRYGETVTEFPELTAEGYVFQGWNYGKETYSSSNGKVYVMGNSNVTFKAVWAEGEASYTVKHLFINVSTNKFESLADYPDEQKTGVTGSYTEAAAKDVPGYTPYNINQKRIEADCSTVVEIKYNTNYYTLSYDDGIDSESYTVPSSQKYRYGQTINVLSTISIEGDEFLGWSDGTSLYVPSSDTNTFVMPNHDVTLTAQWKYGAKYTAEHYFEELDGTFPSEIYSSNRDVISGKAGSLTNAVPRNREGFTAQPVVQQTVAADGSSVVEIKYYRNVHTVTFDYGYEGSVPYTVEYRYGASVQFTSARRAGYLFENWKYGSEVYLYGSQVYGYSSIEFDMPDEDVTFTAQWRPDTQTVYTFRRLYQKLNGDGYESDESHPDITFYGETDSYTDVLSYEYIWYRYGFTAQPMEEKIIAGDGSTVVEMKLDRNVHTVTYADGVDDETISVPAAKEYRCGETVTVAANITRPGYNFKGWYTGNKYYGGSYGTENSFVMSDEDLTLTAEWSRASVEYKVRHLFQKVSGDEYETNPNYPEETKTGLYGDTTYALSTYVPGFSYIPFNQEPIAADGSTVIEIKYDRIVRTVTYSAGVDDESISVPSSQDYRYGATVTVAANISRTGYSFAGWSDGSTVYTSMGTNNSFTMPSHNVTLTAQWTAANVNYKVRHLFQKLSGNEYESNADYAEEIKSGTTGSTTNAVAKNVTGFTALSFNQKTIAANGSTVVEIKYDRNVHSVTYADGVADETISVPPIQSYRYGATVNVAANISRTGYSFAGWSDGSSVYTSMGNPNSFTMADSNITLTAQWNAANVNYKVRHVFQKVSGNEYESNNDYPEETKTGTTATLTNALSKNVTGFIALSFSQKTIAADGSTVVEIRYNRNVHTVTYADGVADENITVPAPHEYRYGASVNLSYGLRRSGYVFIGWSNGEVIYNPLETLNFELTDSDVILTALWALKEVAQDVVMKSGSDINSILHNNLGAKSSAKYFKPSQNPPSESFTTYELSQDSSGVSVVAWLDGDIIYYYAEGITDTPGKLIPLTDCCNMFNYLNFILIDMSGFDTSNVTNMSSMFWGCDKLTILDVSGFDTSNVIYMNSMFSNCESLELLNVLDFDTSNVTDMSYMFYGCEKLLLLDVSGFDTSNVTNMKRMFYKCLNLTELNLSSFGTRNVTDMSFMFYYCNLTELDLSSFDTSNVTDMSDMFYFCNKLTELNLSSFDTSNVTDMSCMFYYCEELTELNLSSFEANNVTDISSMFQNCYALTKLDLSSFDIRNGTSIMDLTYISSMFKNCSSLTTIYAAPDADWSVLNNLYSEDMFVSCGNLTGGNGTSYDSSYKDKTRACVDGLNGKPGYFTAKSE